MWICEVCGYENEITAGSQKQVCACCGEALSQERLNIILSKAENERKKALKRQRRDRTQERIRRCHDAINTFKTYWTVERTFRMASTICATGICACGIWLGVNALIGDWSVNNAMDDSSVMLEEKVTMWADGLDFVRENRQDHRKLIWQNTKQQLSRVNDRINTRGIFGIKPYNPGGSYDEETTENSVFADW